MSLFASRGRQLEELLQALTLRVQVIRGLMLVDRDGLVLVSTLRAHTLEESLAAFTGLVLGQMDRAREDFHMGPLHLLHLAGRDRQVLLVPVSHEAVLAGLVDAGANATDATLQLLALARDILEVVQRPSEAPSEPGR